MANDQKRTYLGWMKIMKRRSEWKGGKKDPRVENRMTKPTGPQNTK